MKNKIITLFITSLLLSALLLMIGCSSEKAPEVHTNPNANSTLAELEKQNNAQITNHGNSDDKDIYKEETNSNQQNSHSEQKDTYNKDDTVIQIDEDEVAESSSAPSGGNRDNTPQCLIPSPDGSTVAGNESVSIDLSHTDQGYFMVKYNGNNPKVKLQLTGPNQITYTYDLSSSYEAFPFTSSNGSYTIAVFENISGNQYAVACQETVSVSIANEFLPYLYSNQYVNFTADSLTVEAARKLASDADSDLTVVSNVYNYIIKNSTYDYDKAKNVQSGYIPVVDDFLTSKTGICFDFASTMAAMLRSQGIPTRLEIGYAGEAYHAWISTYLDEKGWVNGIIEFDGVSWKLMDPTFAASSSEKALKKFIGDGDNYVTKYMY